MNDRELLERSEQDKSQQVVIRVTACAYACCGKGWHHRAGYEQTYSGWIDNLTDKTFMLYSPGIGTISYVVAVRFAELLEVEPAGSGIP